MGALSPVLHNWYNYSLFAQGGPRARSLHVHTHLEWIQWLSCRSCLDRRDMGGPYSWVYAEGVDFGLWWRIFGVCGGEVGRGRDDFTGTKTCIPPSQTRTVTYCTPRRGCLSRSHPRPDGNPSRNERRKPLLRRAPTGQWGELGASPSERLSSWPAMI